MTPAVRFKDEHSDNDSIQRETNKSRLLEFNHKRTIATKPKLD